MNIWRSPIDSANSGCILKLFQGKEKSFPRSLNPYNMAAKSNRRAGSKTHVRQSWNGGMFYVAQHFW